MRPAETRERTRQSVVDSLAPDDFEGTAYDDLTRMAAKVCQASVAVISIVDGEHLLFKSRVGTDVANRPRELSFCGHAVNDAEHVTIVEDASKDERFATNPNVVGDPKVRFYAGVPLIYESQPIGTLCVFDTEPRSLELAQVEELRFLAQQVMATLEELRRGRRPAAER